MDADGPGRRTGGASPQGPEGGGQPARSGTPDRRVWCWIGRHCGPSPWRFRRQASVDPALIEGPWTPEEAAILSRFFSGTALTSIPSSRGKRRIVLERLAMEFEVGLRYGEREVNLVLEAFHEDYTSLRRYLVDEGFLSRESGVYWRTGGRT